MTGPQQTNEETTRVLAAAGIEVTEEGRQRARSRLAQATARMTDERWDELRERYFRYSDPA
jgi:hypothetical protein